MLISIGYVAAIKAGQKGLKAVCIEKRGALGGTCLNVGCIPSKALLNSTNKMHDAMHGFKELGIETGPITMNFPQLMKSKDKAVNGLTSGIEYLLKKNGVDYLKGWGKFESPHDIAVDLIEGGTSTIRAKNTIIATGSEPTSFPPGMLDVDEKYVVTSTGGLSLESIPKKMIVIGGGVIGLELGSVYNRLGSEVTVLQHTEVVCPFLDREIANHFQKILQKQGLKILTNTRFKSGVNNKEKGVQCVIEGPKGEETLEADVVLLSIGRKAFTGGMNIEKAGLALADHGKL